MTAFLRCSLFLAAAVAVMASVPCASSGGVATADIPSPSSLKQSPSPQKVSAAADTSQADSDEDAPRPQTAAPKIVGDMSQPLKPEMKVQIIRYIDGEFGKAAKSLPGKTNGFTIAVGKGIDGQTYSDALRLQGTAVNVGDPVQVTRLDFDGKRIVIQLNGGAKKKFHLRDHLQIGLSAGGQVAGSDGTASHRQEGLGAVIVLDYGRPIPNVSPDDIRQELSALIDFSKQPSAAVNWVETLPPKYQDAIRDHKALAGMDQEMVIAAIGRPDKKVRQKNMDGVETEDWIYGNPPAKTVFVTFIGNTVEKVEEFD